MEGIMTTKLEKLRSKASQLVWPAIATAAVLTGGVLAHDAVQAGKAQNPVGVGASLAGLVGVAVGAGCAKRENQSRRDKELGIRDESGYPTINAGNFVAATERCKDLDRQSTALICAPWAGVATALATAAFATAAFAPAAAAIGCSLVLVAMYPVPAFRKIDLELDLVNAESKILEDSQSNPANVLAEAYSFLTNLHQL
jgi:hypothetical protein